MDWFKHFPFLGQDYRVSRLLIYFFVLVSVGLCVFALSLNGFSGRPYVFISCPSQASGNCLNSAYGASFCGSEIPLSDPLCSTEYLFPGQHLGVMPPWIVSNLYNVLIGFGILIILVNHLLFNKSFSFKGLIQ